MTEDEQNDIFSKVLRDAIFIPKYMIGAKLLRTRNWSWSAPVSPTVYCNGEQTDTKYGVEFDCGYDTAIGCDECIYNKSFAGGKAPELNPL